MKKDILKYILSGMLLMIFTVACDDDSNSEPEQKITNTEVTFELDAESNLKNPYMGWTLYSEGGQQTDKPATYWYLQDDAKAYAGVFYIRWRWSDLEPEEGVYAWDHNEDFKGLIQGALDRGLRLAFRIYVNGRDNLHPATPDFVLNQAQTYEVYPGHQTPYADDEFFLEKYTNFIAAFGKKFNDPSIVDYVDSYGLGWWGEGHNIKYMSAGNKYASHNRIVRAYAKAFDKVINVINFGVRDAQQQTVVYDELSFSPRRDGYASEWFTGSDQIELMKHFPTTPVIAEACYWKSAPISSYENGRWSSWPEYYHDVVKLAIQTHANYLDLRTYTETSRYLNDAMDEVKKFISQGGYRIYPKKITYSITQEELELEHTWQNAANGVLPNNNVSLGYKYKVAFALFDKDNNKIAMWLSDSVEVSDLVDLTVMSVTDKFDVSEIESDNYQLGVAIINTREDDSKDIALAIKDANKIVDEWVFVGDVSIKN